MGDMIVKQSSGLAINDGPTVLGERQARIPVGGKIRPGIKVLTSAAKRHPKAQKIYDDGVTAGKSWAEVERELRQQCEFQKSPLTPRNVPFFTVRRADFNNPAHADQILEKYADEDGHLYSFPIVFPTDNWQANLPHALRTYRRNELVYWSDYDAEGRRRCYTKKHVEVDQKARRAHRPFGGRPTVLRPDNGGICDPDNCPEYQQRKCNLSGQMLFFVPGIASSSAFSIPTTSFYALEQAREKMELVAYLRGGRISGTHEGKPIFYLTKREEEVSMIDPETGEPRRVRQYLVTLEADIDMLQVFRDAERRLAHAGEAAAHALEHQVDPDEDAEPEHDYIEAEARPVEPEPEPAPQDEADDEREQIKALRASVAHQLEQLEIDHSLFRDYAAHQLDDPDWGRKLGTLQWASDELDTAAEAEDLDAWKAERELDTPF